MAKHLGPFEFEPEKSKRKNPRPHRVFAGAAASEIVFWLNHLKGDPAYDRVVRIHGLLSQLESATQHTRVNRKQKSLSTSQAAAQDELNSILKSYSSYPTIEVMHTVTSTELPVSRTPEFSSDSVLLLFDIPGKKKLLPRGSHFVMTEHGTVESLLGLFEEKRMSEVRLCEQCREIWIVSKRSIDRFHSASCRLKFHASSDEAKAKHVRNQEAYRRRLRNGIEAGRREK